uniref:acyl-CoA dehydrogenase N-terminal domain-containing protein n=1 Tax=Paraburkholderia sediminicola TaxID=458836 RepID=UPI0038BDDD51
MAFWNSLTSYTAPITDVLFVINQIVHFDRVSTRPAFEAFGNRQGQSIHSVSVLTS